MADFLETPYVKLTSPPAQNTRAYSILLQTLCLALRSTASTREIRYEAARLLSEMGADQKRHVASGGVMRNDVGDSIKHRNVGDGGKGSEGNRSAVIAPGLSRWDAIHFRNSLNELLRDGNKKPPASLIFKT